MLIADEALPAEKLHTALGAAAMWTTSHCMPLLPYSCVVLESVPEAEARAHMPSPWHASTVRLSTVLPPVVLPPIVCQASSSTHDHQLHFEVS